MLCSSDIQYGDAILAGHRGAMGAQRQVQQISTQQEVATSLFSHVTKLDRSGVYVFLCINCCVVMTDTVVCPVFFYILSSAGSTQTSIEVLL
jgi:hypothetical protein